jgi:hypothetical protein
MARKGYLFAEQLQSQDFRPVAGYKISCVTSYAAIEYLFELFTNR